ncbi:hypothetical protein CLOM_g7984 [Closterium sp. NIES-68]|nr:hypothetical protein CLOM_g7984 [Closterium sp. NIES-68]GJP72918.1 hypothetical protein CLOP_g3688 [Closterium sp. NIES-67]
MRVAIRLALLLCLVAVLSSLLLPVASSSNISPGGPLRGGVANGGAKTPPNAINEGEDDDEDDLLEVLQEVGKLGNYSFFTNQLLTSQAFPEFKLPKPPKKGNGTKNGGGFRLIKKKRTIFMPVDTGMIRVTLQSYPRDVAMKIFRFHIAKGMHDFMELKALPSQAKLPTYEGGLITKVSRKNTKLIVQLKGKGFIPTTIVTGDLQRGRNTIVHGITSLMLPPDL